MAPADAIPPMPTSSPVLNAPVTHGDTVFSAPLLGVGAVSDQIEGKIVVLHGGPGEPLELALLGNGFEPGDHAWHIHTGPCAASGPIEVALSDAEGMPGITGPVAADETGQVEVSVEVPRLARHHLGAGGRSLHIHKNPGIDPGPTIACTTI
jgi:hypothetical protein